MVAAKNSRSEIGAGTIRDTNRTAYRCFLPDLTGFTTVRHTGARLRTQTGCHARAHFLAGRHRQGGLTDQDNRPGP